MSTRKPYRRRKPVGNVSRRGAALVAMFEGFSSKSYQDAVGVWTIGYGHTRGVHANTRSWSRAFGLHVLRLELNGPTYAGAVRALNREIGGALTAPMFDALASFVYNVGPGAIAADTGIGRELRAHHWHKAADELLKWDKGGGRVLLGLTRRRTAERRLFLLGVPAPAGPSAHAPSTHR